MKDFLIISLLIILALSFLQSPVDLSGYATIDQVNQTHKSITNRIDHSNKRTLKLEKQMEEVYSTF